MTATAIATAATAEKPIPKVKKPLTWEAFKRTYLLREDDYTYELVNGEVIKTKRTMDYTQAFIVRNLLRLFTKIQFQNQLEGWLTNEIDTFFDEAHRRPDMCYLTDKQIDLSKQGVAPVPQFIIEIVSNNDKAKRVQEKMKDYLRAGVPVIWHIFPDLEMVHVYHGKKMQVCEGEDLCTAAPILPDFVLSAQDIFK